MIHRALLSAFVVGVFGLTSLAWAEQPKPLPVLGILMAAAPANDALVQSLREGLRERGYVEGRNIRFEYRGAEGHAE